MRGQFIRDLGFLGKLEALYWHALHQVFVASDWNLYPKSATFDFEQGLINAVQHQFDESEINGYLFHWRQALRKK